MLNSKKIYLILSISFTLFLFVFFTSKANEPYLDCRDLPITNRGGSDQLDYFTMSSGVKSLGEWKNSLNNEIVINWIYDVNNYKNTNPKCYEKNFKNIEYVSEKINLSKPSSRYALRPWGYPTLLSIFLVEKNPYFQLRLFNVLISAATLLVIYMCTNTITKNPFISMWFLNFYLVISFVEMSINPRLSIYTYQFLLLTEPLSLFIYSLIGYLFIRHGKLNIPIVFLFFLSYFIKQMNLIIFIVFICLYAVLSFIKYKSIDLKIVLYFLLFLSFCIPIFVYNFQTTQSYSLITGAGGWRDMPPSFNLDYKIKNFYTLRADMFNEYINDKGISSSSYIENALISREMFFDNLGTNIKNLPQLFIYKLGQSLRSISGILTIFSIFFYLIKHKFKNDNLNLLILLFLSNLIFINLVTPDFGRHLFQSSYIYIIISAYMYKNLTTQSMKFK